MFIIVDATIFLLLLFMATRAAFLLEEEIYSAATAAFHIGVSSLILLILSTVFLRCLKRISVGRLIRLLVTEQVVFLLIVFLL
ncbi:MAG: hypothetical protein ABIH66_03185, partial [bacterium]